MYFHSHTHTQNIKYLTIELLYFLSANKRLSTFFFIKFYMLAPI